MADWLNLEGKVVIVTGGASGIGNHVVTTLKDAGATPVIADISVETGEEKDGIFCTKCDVTNKESVEAMVAAVVEKYGKLDAIVNNAGVNLPRLLVDVKGEKPEYELDEKSFAAGQRNLANTTSASWQSPPESWKQQACAHPLTTKHWLIPAASSLRICPQITPRSSRSDVTASSTKSAIWLPSSYPTAPAMLQEPPTTSPAVSPEADRKKTNPLPHQTGISKISRLISVNKFGK